jgi:hypothetical protein
MTMALSPMRRRLVNTALRLYPRAWRERYGEELRDLLGEGSLTVRVFADVARAAMRERVASGLAWQLGATALLALGPFLVIYYLLPVAMTGRMKWGDPLLSLVIEPGPLVDLWLTPLVIGLMLPLVLRRTASPGTMSRWAGVWCGISCAVVTHAVLLFSNIIEHQAWSFLLSTDWWREVYPQVILLHAGFGTIGLIAHRLIAVPSTSKRMVSTR